MLISLVDNKYSSKLQIFIIYIAKGSKLRLFIKHFCFFNCSPHKMEYQGRKVGPGERRGGLGLLVTHAARFSWFYCNSLQIQPTFLLFCLPHTIILAHQTYISTLRILAHQTYISTVRHPASCHINQTFLLFATQHLGTSIFA